MNTTQPNISARISALELSLGVTLMQRDAGSVRLTSKGLELLEYARNVLRSTDELIAAANQDGLVDGQLRLGVTEMIVHTWVRDFLRILKETYPNITVELTVDLSTNLEKELFDRSIDLALQNGPFIRQISGSEDLGVYPMVWIASPQIELSPIDFISIEDLTRFPILTHARGTLPYDEVVAHFAQRRELTARLVPSSNLAACIHMAIDGFGVAAVPLAMVSDELRTGELIQLNYDWVPQSLRFCARYDADRSPRFVAGAAGIANEVSNQYLIELAAALG
jgi:DNA-binding transcriptional LysR family regulator